MNIKNGDMPASPVLDDWENFVAFMDGTKGGRNYGMTKRETFAMAAMQAWITHHGTAGGYGYNDVEMAEAAVLSADTLLKELLK